MNSYILIRSKPYDTVELSMIKNDATAKRIDDMVTNPLKLID